jgi:hypothetical protein
MEKLNRLHFERGCLGHRTGKLYIEQVMLFNRAGEAGELTCEEEVVEHTVHHVDCTANRGGFIARS